MTTYRIKEFVCEAMLVTPGTTTAQEILDFGFGYADPTGDGTGMNIGFTGESTSLFYDPVYLVKVVSPRFSIPIMSMMSPAELDAQLEVAA